MNNNLLKEIKHRTFFIFINWFFSINLFYYYKDVILFIIVKQLNYLNDLDFYLVYTNITELFIIYIKLINFCSSQISFLFIVYHTLVFCLPTLYKKEFYFILHLFLFFLIINLVNMVCFSVILNFVIVFLKEFQEPYVHFELKVTEILYFLLQLFLRVQLGVNCLLVIAALKWSIKFFRHFSYFLIIIQLLYSCLNGCSKSYNPLFLIFIISCEFIYFVYVIIKQKV